MNEKKKTIILLSIIGAIILLIVAGSFYESNSSSSYLKQFYSDFNGSENKLVMIGRNNCSWCQLYHPVLDYMHEEYGFDYTYVDTNELTAGSFKKLLKDINVDSNSFGTPLTLVVKDGNVVDSINGYVDETVLFEFLKKYEFVSKDAKLVLNYLDYSGYEKLLKSEHTKVLVIGQTSCTYCIKAKPILSKVASDNDVKINFLNITDLNDEEKTKFMKSLSYLKENEWGTPLTLIIKNGEVLDDANGLLDYDGYVNLLKKNGLIK